MRNALSAEWRKTNYNRWLVGFTVWIFPVGAIVFLTIGALFTLLSDVAFESVRFLNWREQMIGSWEIPTNFFGQLFVVVLAATLFASESGLNTWKNLAPRAKRWQLVMAKFVVVVVLMFIAYNLMAIVTGVMSILILVLAGAPINPALNTLDWGAFLGEYVQSALISVVAVLLSTCFAVIGAIVARSVQVGIVLGIGVLLLEQALPVVFILLSRLLDIPRLVVLHHLTPSYNLQNLNTYFHSGTGFTLFGEWAGLEPNSAALSALILAIWLVVLIAFSVGVFMRRDVG